MTPAPSPAQSSALVAIAEQACFVSWRHEQRAESLRPLLERYGPAVFSFAHRRLGSLELAAEATRAVFLVMARRRQRAHKLERWLLKITRITCRKLKVRSFSWVREWFEPKHAPRELRPLPEGLIDDILAAIAAAGRKAPREKLARWVLRKLFWARWRNRAAWAAFAFFWTLVVAVGISASTGNSWAISKSILWSTRFEVAKFAEPVRPWTGQLEAKTISSSADLYRTTNVWPTHVEFTTAQWKALYPKHIGSLPNFITRDGLILLRNPEAPRSGLAGVMGYAFDWSSGEVEFGGARFENAGVRIKGNVGALIEPKRPFKVDLNRNVKGQKIGGVDQLTFNNLMWDNSCLRDALAYEFFRDAGVPAPRTAYAWVTATVPKKWDHQPLGLFLLLESVDEDFGADRFGTKNTAFFKPVTYEFFKYLGDDWGAYAPIYDLKTKATDEEKRQIIGLARLLTNANDAEFAARVGEFLDLEEFAGFLAGEMLLACYDGILSTGQNFYMYVDPRSKKIGFIPWDLDMSWGNFWVGSKAELQRSSIWHPWAGENRFLERVFKVEEFRKLYRARLEVMLARWFLPDRLQKRIAEIAAAIRGPIGAESKFRLDKFEQEIGNRPVIHTPGEPEFGVNQPAYPYRKFIETRARSVRDQLNGKTKGLIIPPLSDKL